MTRRESLVGIREENWGLVGDRAEWNSLLGRNTALWGRYNYSQDHTPEM